MGRVVIVDRCRGAEPIAASVPREQIRDAVRLQATRHVHGEVVVTW